MGETLQLDEEINVPNIANNEEKNVEESYGYYTVLPKEGFFRLKIKLGLTQEELETLNPELVDSGLKEGMILKVPLDVGSTMDSVDIERSTLVDRLNNFDTKRIAVIWRLRMPGQRTPSAAWRPSKRWSGRPSARGCRCSPSAS